MSLKRLLGGGVSRGGATLPRKLGICQAPTCLSSLLSSHILTSSPDITQVGDSQHLRCNQGRGGTQKPPARVLRRLQGDGRRPAPGGGRPGVPELHQDGVEEMMLRARSLTICPCPASSSTISWSTSLTGNCPWGCLYSSILLDSRAERLWAHHFPWAVLRIHTQCSLNVTPCSIPSQASCVSGHKDRTLWSGAVG